MTKRAYLPVFLPLACGLMIGLATCGQAQQDPFHTDSVWAKFHASIPDSMHLRVFRAFKDRKAGWMNVHGEWVIPPEYDIADGMSGKAKWEWKDRFLICSKDQRFGVVSMHNEVIVPFRYKAVKFAGNSFLALGGEGEERQVYYDRGGRKIGPDDPAFIGGRTMPHVVVPVSQRERGNSWNSAWIPSDGGPFSYASRNVSVVGHIGSGASEVDQHDLEVWDLDGSRLLSFNQVPFMLRFYPADGGYRRFVIMPFVPKHANLGEMHGVYGFLDTAGNVVIPPRFKAEPMVREQDRKAGDGAAFELKSGLARVVVESSFRYVDLQGRVAFELPMRDTEASAFNCCGIAVYQVHDRVSNTRRTVFVDRTVKEVLRLDRGYMGIVGNQWSHPPDHLIPVVDGERNEVRLFTPTMEQFGTLPLSDGANVNYSYTGYHDQQPGHLELLCRANYPGAPECYRKPGHYRIVDENNAPLSSWFPTCVLLDRTYGLYAEITEDPFTQTVYDLSGRVIQQLDSMVYGSNDQAAANGLFEFQNPVRYKRALMNYKGEMLSDRCDHWDASSITDLGETSPAAPRDIVRVKFTEADVIGWYNESGLDEQIRR